MKLSDAVSNAGLSIYTEIALLVFLVTFVGIVVYTYSRRNREKYDQASHIPLHEDEPVTPVVARGEGATR